MIIVDELQIGDILSHDESKSCELITNIECFYDIDGTIDRIKVYSRTLDKNLKVIEDELFDSFADCSSGHIFYKWSLINNVDFDLGI